MFDTMTDTFFSFADIDKLQVMLHARLMRDYGFKRIAVPWDPKEDFSRAEGPIPPDCPRVFATLVIPPAVVLYFRRCYHHYGIENVSSAVISNDQPSVPVFKQPTLPFTTVNLSILHPSLSKLL